MQGKPQAAAWGDLPSGGTKGIGAALISERFALKSQ